MVVPTRRTAWLTPLLVVGLCIFTSVAADRKEDGHHHRVLLRNEKGIPSFVTGKLGKVSMRSRRLGAGDEVFKEEAKETLKSILANHMGATGKEDIIPSKEKIFTDSEGATHIRYFELLDGMKIEGGSILMHILDDGTVFGVNGEFVPSDHMETGENLNCKTASASALDEIRLTIPNCMWISLECELTAVIGDDGLAHIALKRMIGYQPDEGPYQKDMLYFGNSVYARFPQVQGDLSIRTINCNGGTSCSSSSLGITTPSEISTGDLAIDKAHNYAIATYNFFWDNYGRDSIDDAGMTLISRVHYGTNYNNAFWDGTQMTYGDGDGVVFIPLSRDADVVAHELTHGITGRTSRLIYTYESGALNEAISDIFGAAVDRQEGATITDTWLLGEDVFTPSIPGDGLRNMADPASRGDYDYYPDRYTGSEDNGGVHWNSGIANLAFVLMVEGGTHPRGKTAVNVPSIHSDFDTSLLAAAEIFYKANTACLTARSDFAMARLCTMIHAGSHGNSVGKAWDAVGVPDRALPQLQNNVPLSGQSAVSGEADYYVLEGVLAGETVTCTLSANNGDADLYVRFGTLANPSVSSPTNDCRSISSSSNEECTTEPATESTSVYATAHAWSSYNDLTITCRRNGGMSPLELTSPPTGMPTGVPTGVPTTKPTSPPTVSPNGEPTGVPTGVPTTKPTSPPTVSPNGEPTGIPTGVPTITPTSPPTDSPNDLPTTFAPTPEPTYTPTASPNETPTRLPTGAPTYEPTTSPASTIDLVDGFPTSGQQASAGQILYYQLSGVQSQEAVTCVLSADNGDADLYVRLGDPAIADHTSALNSCSSYTETSNEACTTPASTSAQTVFVAVHAWSPFAGLSIICRRYPPLVALSDGVPLTSQTGIGGYMQDYAIDVLAGEEVTCTTDGPNGDADLFVRFGDLADPDDASSDNHCSSTSSNSNEACTTSGTAPSDTVAYVGIEAYSSFTELTITCSRQAPAPPTCSDVSQTCAARTDCCEFESNQCDQNQCKVCKPRKRSCSRHSECCSGRCRRRRGRCR